MTDDNPFGPGATAGASGRTDDDWMAIAALVLGLLSCGFSCLTGIPAIVLGWLGLKRAHESKRPLAVVGLVMGVINTLLAVAALVIVLALSVLGASLQQNFDEIERELGQPVLEDTDF